MNLSNINTIARYEAKILRRSWLFRLLAMLSLTGVASFQILMQGNMVQWYSWNVIALSSYVPYLNVYLFGIVQALTVVFLSCDLISKNKKLDTVETIYARSMSNGDYVIGKALGGVLVLMVLSLCSLLLGAIINIFLTDAPFNGWMYLFYWAVFLLPSLVFVLGLTFYGISLTRHKPLTILLLLGYIYLTLYYLVKLQQGLFDFFGSTIPNTLSDITGYPDLYGVLLQRLGWLFLGMGFIGYSILLLKRIPNCPGRGNTQLGVSTFIVIIGLISGSLVFMRGYKNISDRKRYKAIYEKYDSKRKLTLYDQNITYRQSGDKLKISTRLCLKNEHTERVNPVVLYLNPGLKVYQIFGNGEKVVFSRENQVILINESVEAGGILDLEVEYSGKIDESICYLELPDEYVSDTRTIGSVLFRGGKRYAILDKDYTLLTPESIWYPVSVPPVNLSDVYAIEKNFTNYGLRVIGENERTVLSQGDQNESGDTLIFNNRHGLPGISLCIGSYKSYKVAVDSVSFELYLVEGHNNFMENLSYIKDSIPGIIAEFKRKVEEEKNRRYPYDRFMIVEAPVSYAAYFRNERGGSEKVQPEIVFLPERGVGFWNMNLKKMKQVYQKLARMEEVEIERTVLSQLLDGIFVSEYDILREGNPLTGRLFITNLLANLGLRGNPFTLSPLFYNHVNYLYSSEFPIVDMVLNNLLREKEDGKESWINDFSTRSGSYKKAMNYLKNHSLEEALKDSLITFDVLYQLVKLKSTTLKEQHFCLNVSSGDFKEFIKRYWEEHKFEKMDFISFNKDFTERFGISWLSVLPEWYTMKQIPSFVIRDAYMEEIDNGKDNQNFYDKRYRIHANVYNESDVDGAVALTYTEYPKPKSSNAPIVSRDIMPTYSKNVLIGAKKAKEIVIVSEGVVSKAFLNTIISENLPTIITIPQINGKTREMDPGIRDIDESRFFPPEGELIVDNESDGFRVLQASNDNHLRRWLNPGPSSNEYKEFNFVTASEDWTLVTHYGFYGGRIRSGWMKNSGDGRAKAEWSVKIEKAGYYEVFMYLPSDVRLKQMKAGIIYVQSSEKVIKQNYIVQHDGKETEASIEISYSDRGWLSLGRFYFSPSEASVVLTDKGSIDNQIIYADAVKWVFDGENELSKK